jgi:hypothetical protein
MKIGPEVKSVLRQLLIILVMTVLLIYYPFLTKEVNAGTEEKEFVIDCPLYAAFHLEDIVEIQRCMTSINVGQCLLKLLLDRRLIYLEPGYRGKGYVLLSEGTFKFQIKDGRGWVTLYSLFDWMDWNYIDKKTGKPYNLLQ